MYTINSNQLTTSSTHIGEITSHLDCLSNSPHSFELNGLIDQQDPYYQPYVPRGIYKNMAFKDLPTIAQGYVLEQICLKERIPFAEGVRKMGKLLGGLMKKQEKRRSHTVTTTHPYLCYSLSISLKSSHRHWSSLKKTRMFTTHILYHKKYGAQMALQFSQEAHIPQDWDIRSFQQILHKSRGGVLPTVTNTPPPVTQGTQGFQKPLISISNQKDLYLCSGKKKKSVTKIAEEERKAVSTSEPSFETPKQPLDQPQDISSSAPPEQPQDRTAMKTTEFGATPESLSETQTKPRETKEKKKAKPISSSTFQASSKRLTGHSEEELNTIAQDVHEEFLVLFNPEEDKRFACHKTDFFRMVKARTKSHLGCATEMKTYMRKFSINQYYMGKRMQRNGKFFHPTVWSLWSQKIIDDYQKKDESTFFTPYNELDLTKSVEVQGVKEVLKEAGMDDISPSSHDAFDEKLTQAILAVVHKEKKKTMTSNPRNPRELNPLPVLQSSSQEVQVIKKSDEDKQLDKKGEAYWRTLSPEAQKNWEDMFYLAIGRGETSFRADQDLSDPFFRKFKTIPFMCWIGAMLTQAEQRDILQTQQEQQERIDHQAPALPSLAESQEREQTFPNEEIFFPDLPHHRGHPDREGAEHPQYPQTLDYPEYLESPQEWEEAECVEFEDFPKEEEQDSDSEELGMTLVRNKSTFYRQNVRRTLHTLLLCATFWSSAQAVEINSCFTPQQQCLPLILEEITQARSEILLQAYSLTSKPISKALRDAHDRGVKVKILVDQSQEKSPNSQVRFLKESGIDVLVDDKVRIAHNKVIVIDGTTLIGGSYNFSAAAEKHNAENLLIVKDDPVVKRYQENWWTRRRKARNVQK